MLLLLSISILLIVTILFLDFIRYIWERPAETGHRARMIYFEKNGFNIQLEFSSGRKRFAIKTMAPLGRAGKNLSI